MEAALARDSARIEAAFSRVNLSPLGACAITTTGFPIDRDFTARKLETKMLLQVHDELLFESPPEEAAEVAKMVKREMESVYRIEVPLVVDVGIGENWRRKKTAETADQALAEPRGRVRGSAIQPHLVVRLCAPLLP